MTRGRIASIGIIVGLGVLVTASGWAFRASLEQQWWLFRGGQALSPEELLALDKCEDPGWVGQLRVLVQDVDVSACGEAWLVDTFTLAAHGQVQGWLRSLVEREDEVPRLRGRAGLLLVRSGETTPVALFGLLSDPELSSLRRAAVELVGDERMADSWLDPFLREEVALWQLANGDVEQADVVARRMRTMACNPRSLEADRLEVVEIASAAVGLGDGRLEELIRRRSVGLGIHSVPTSLGVQLTRRSDVCADRATPPCLRLMADLLSQLEETADWIDEAPPEESVQNPHPLASALWEVLYPSDRQVQRALVQELALLQGWLASLPVADRALALQQLVHQSEVPVREGPVAGDPMWVIRQRHGAPWSTALAVMLLAQDADVDVHVEPFSDGVRLHVGPLERGIGVCGEPLALPSEEEEAAPLGEAWSLEAVAAQSAVEAAGQAWRAGDRVQAQALITLALKLDPTGIPDLRAAMALADAATLESDAALGQTMGNVVQAMIRPSSTEEGTSLPASWLHDPCKGG